MNKAARLLLIFSCIVFAVAILTGCGGDDPQHKVSKNTVFPVEQSGIMTRLKTDGNKWVWCLDGVNNWASVSCDWVDYNERYGGRRNYTHSVHPDVSD